MQMSTAHFRRWAVLLLLAGLFAGNPARSEALQRFKDALFSTQTVLESRDGGDFEVIDYQELRDINGRDQIPERRAKSKYVDLGVKRQQSNETLRLPSGNLDVARVGKADGAAFTVIFIHGRGGAPRGGVAPPRGGGDF